MTRNASIAISCLNQPVTIPVSDTLCQLQLSLVCSNVINSLPGGRCVLSLLCFFNLGEG